MAILLFFVAQQAGLLEIELILEGELAVFARRPDHPTDGGEGGNHPIEKFAVELARGDVCRDNWEISPIRVWICRRVCSMSSPAGCS